jgi:hypothetical protein
VLINNALVVQGGKTDQYNSYTYTGAPSISDILYLPMSSAFTATSPPWQLVSDSSNTSAYTGPSLSWHTLSAFNTTSVLLFGGQPGPNSDTVLPSQADSAALLNVDNPVLPFWVNEPTSWAGEPERRMRHSASSVGGKVYLIGGERADGSNGGFADHYVFDFTGPTFTKLPSTNAPPDIFGHTSIVLDNGNLLVFGGYSASQAALLPFSTIWTLDTSQSTPAWSSISVSNSTLPASRMGFASTLTQNGRIIIHGGVDVSGTVFSDGWSLDTTTTPLTWSRVDALAQLGQRRDHFAVSSGSQIIFGFGKPDNAT